MTTTTQTTISAARFHWRRLFQFRLRTLLIGTTILAVWLGWWLHKARQQREAVETRGKNNHRNMTTKRQPLLLYADLVDAI